MSVLITSEKQESYLLIRVSGELEDLAKLTSVLNEEVIKFDSNIVIMDLRDLELPDSLMEYVDAVSTYQRDFPIEGHSRKVAVVVNPAYKDAAQFWETYSRNRGFLHEAVTSIEDAEEWIKRVKT